MEDGGHEPPELVSPPASYSAAVNSIDADRQEDPEPGADETRALSQAARRRGPFHQARLSAADGSRITGVFMARRSSPPPPSASRNSGSISPQRSWAAPGTRSADPRRRRGRHASARGLKANHSLTTSTEHCAWLTIVLAFEPSR